MICLPLGGFSVLNVGQRGIQPAWVLGLFIFVLYLINVILGNKYINKNIINIAIIILWFFLFLSISSSIISGNNLRIIDFFTTYFSFSISMLVFFSITSFELSFYYLEKIIRWYIIISALMAVLGIVQFVCSYLGYPFEVNFTNKSWMHYAQKSGYENILGGFKRSAGLLREPRQFGLYLTGSITLLFYLFYSRSLRILKSSNIILLFMVVGFGILCSMSLSAFIITVICLTIVAAIHFQKIIHFKSLVNLAYVAAFASLITFLLFKYTDIEIIFYWKRFKVPNVSQLWNVFIELPERENAYGYSHYIANISFAFHVFMDHPLFGVGVNNLPHFSMKGYYGAHHPWRLVAESGLLGTTAFCCFIVIFIFQIKRLGILIKRYDYLFPRHYYSMLNIAFLFVLVAPIKGMGSLYNYYSIFFWFDMTIAGIIYFNIKKKTYNILSL
jgi:hypothetical protein